MRDDVGAVSVEVVLCSTLNLVKLDSNKVIAVGGRLHVVKAESVKELVNDCVEAEAASFNSVRLQVQELLAATSTN